MPFVRKADVENHNRDGGFWVVYNNKVYDIQDRYISAQNFGDENDLQLRRE